MALFFWAKVAMVCATGCITITISVINLLCRIIHCCHCWCYCLFCFKVLVDRNKVERTFNVRPTGSVCLVFQPRCGRWQNARVSASLRLFHPRKLRNNLPVIFPLDDLQFSIEALADNVQYSQPTRVTIHGIQSVLGVISTPNNALFAFTGSWHLSKLDSLPSKVWHEWKVDFCRELNGYTYAFAATFAFASIMIALPSWRAILETWRAAILTITMSFFFRHAFEKRAMPPMLLWYEIV